MCGLSGLLMLLLLLCLSLFSSLVNDSSDSNGDVDMPLIPLVQQMLLNFWQVLEKYEISEKYTVNYSTNATPCSLKERKSLQKVLKFLNEWRVLLTC